MITFLSRWGNIVCSNAFDLVLNNKLQARLSPSTCDKTYDHGQSTINRLIILQVRVVPPIQKAKSSQVRHKATVQCSGGLFRVGRPIHYCDSMSCRDQRARSPRGSLIQEAGYSPQHTPPPRPRPSHFTAGMSFGIATTHVPHHKPDLAL